VFVYKVKYNDLWKSKTRYLMNTWINKW